MIIDKEFESLLPPLPEEDYKGLEESIKKDGCNNALDVWGDTLIDGHNRYKICITNNISFQTKQHDFKDRNEALLFIINNQRRRRNLNDFQRNEISLKYEEVIAEQMKKRQAEYHGNQYEKVDFRPNEPKSKSEPTSKRKELAKIAGTSESSISRTKKILENGTTEQIERARRGGAGNSIGAIEREVKKEKKEYINKEIKESGSDTGKDVRDQYRGFITDKELERVLSNIDYSEFIAEASKHKVKNKCSKAKSIAYLIVEECATTLKKDLPRYQFKK